MRAGSLYLYEFYSVIFLGDRGLMERCDVRRELRRSIGELGHRTFDRVREPGIVRSS